jgi:hypothetical protein
MSSIFDLKTHKILFPKVKMIKKIFLKSITLKTLIKKEKINIKRYQALVIDTQGAELKVLKGGYNFLKFFKYILLETDNCNLYEKSSQIKNINKYMLNANFYEKKGYITFKKNKMELYNILFKNKNFIEYVN